MGTSECRDPSMETECWCLKVLSLSREASRSIEGILAESSRGMKSGMLTRRPPAVLHTMRIFKDSSGENDNRKLKAMQESLEPGSWMRF